MNLSYYLPSFFSFLLPSFLLFLLSIYFIFLFLLLRLTLLLGIECELSEKGPWTSIAPETLTLTDGAFIPDFTAVITSDSVQLLMINIHSANAMAIPGLQNRWYVILYCFMCCHVVLRFHLTLFLMFYCPILLALCILYCAVLNCTLQYSSAQFSSEICKSQWESFFFIQIVMQIDNPTVTRLPCNT